MTPRPTAELWRLLQEATADAAERGHSHVGSEHLLFVLASMPDAFSRSILDHLGVADSVASGVDELMRSDAYANAGSNAVVEDGKLIGHLVVGEGGAPKLERLSPE